jgi:error-prone DNA polymerase
VHHGPEFLCALLNEQPMGFYAPDSLVHEAENRRIAILGLDVNSSEVECTVQNGAVRLGLGYVKDAPDAEMRELVAERARGGRYRTLAELAARSGARRVTLEQLAWSGACDGLIASESGARVGADRRTALWQLGLASPAIGIEDPASEGTSSRKGAWQLALPLDLPVAPPLRKLGRWQRLIADYSTSGVTVGDHAMAVLRERLTAHRLATSAQLTRLPSGCEIALAGLVIARQRPGTANGTMFLLFEDEFGTVNLIVPREVYERRRHLARAEPLLLARGRLERHQEGVRTVLGRGEERGTVVREVTEADGEPIRPVVNLLVRELEPLDRYLEGALAEPGNEGATVRRLEAPSGGREGDADGAEVGSSMRAVAPPIQSFAAGRRR